MFKYILSIFLVLAVFSRFVGLDWGLPYPMHPDERNMAAAVQGLNCEVTSYKLLVSSLKDCFNPNFFAYGQPPLYLGYFLIQIKHLLANQWGTAISFYEATMSLRLQSAVFSILNVFVLYKILNLILGKRFKPLHKYTSILIFIFSPFFIQFSHFGTTESILMLLYSLVVYWSMRVLVKYLTSIEAFGLGIVLGLAVSIKISSAVFVALPFLVMGWKFLKTRDTTIIKQGLVILFAGLVSAAVFSPHNIINHAAFLGSMNYETAVGFGDLAVFYTRSFAFARPVLFQLIKIFPYALGWPLYLLFLVGFFGLSWRNKYYNTLRAAFLIYFIPTSFVFVKWTRFMAPLFPIAVVFATILFIDICESNLRKKQINHYLSWTITTCFNSINSNYNCTWL